MNISRRPAICRCSYQRSELVSTSNSPGYRITQTSYSRNPAPTAFQRIQKRINKCMCCMKIFRSDLRFIGTVRENGTAQLATLFIFRYTTYHQNAVMCYLPVRWDGPYTLLIHSSGWKTWGLDNSKIREWNVVVFYTIIIQR